MDTTAAHESFVLPSDAPEALANSLRAVLAEPDREDLWDLAEDAAKAHQRPEDVGALYRHALGLPLASSALESLGHRAVAYHDEWLDEPASLVAVLSRVFTANPEARWAFERLSMLHTVAERWEDLLDLYDRAIAAAHDDERAALLDEAAHVAKDFAGQAERAIGYLEALFALRPGDAQLARSLERLYERHGRHRSLIDLWTARLPFLPPAEARAARVRVAACWFEQLRAPASSLAAVEAVLAHHAGDPEALGLLERIAAEATSPADTRLRAIELLRAFYDGAGRPDDAVRVLSLALTVAASASDRIALHRELTGRLGALGREAEALEHHASLASLEPHVEEHRARLRELAEKTGRHDRYADALAAAADAARDEGLRTDLLVTAGNVRCDVLGDAAGAIGLFSRVLSTPGAPEGVLLPVARRMVALLAEAGQPQDELDVLELLAGLEPGEDARKDARGRAARLADKLGDTDRSLASWRARLAEDEGDLEALDALADLLTRAARWEPLLEVLRRRAAGDRPVEARRADLVRVANILSGELGRVGPAIEAWTSVRETFGDDPEAVDALASLLASAGRWGELLSLLDHAAANEAEGARRAELLRRLGDAHRTELGEPARAVARYRAALEADPSNEGARAGLSALLEVPECRRASVDALARAFAATDEWARTLELLEHRLSVASDDGDRTALLMEAARLREQRGGDPIGAVTDVRRALPLAPHDEGIERELVRLAAETDAWAVAVEGYRDALEVTVEPARLGDLSFRMGTTLEVRLGDLPSALVAYQRVIAGRPDDLDATAAAVRVAAKTGAWAAAASAVVDSARARGAVAPGLFADLEPSAEAQGAWDGATSALAGAVAEAEGLAPSVARELEARVAVWHRDHRRDADEAEAALVRAVAHDGTDAQTLRMLAELQRRAPGRALVDTLLRLATVKPEDLEALAEAARVTLSLGLDRALAREILEGLRERAAGQWKASGEVGEASAPARHAAWALGEMVRLDTEDEAFGRAVGLLVEGSGLPFTPEASRAMRHEAAGLAWSRLGDAERAVGIYRGILEEEPGDLGAIARLAELYEALGRRDDLLALRRHELSLAGDLARRLSLRLDIARILADAGDLAGRVEALRANLEERAGHEASVEELASVLEATGRDSDLVELLSDQAAKVEGAEGAYAASLWARAASLAETGLGDAARAIACHKRVVALGATATSLDALARLHAARGEHVSSVEWLERRLAMAAPEERAGTVVRLAKAHLDTRRADRARASLEGALSDDPSAREVRALLATLYREAEAWEPLARLLSEGADHVDEATRIAYLREAADLHRRRLGAPEAAIPILERAAALAPEDRGVRLALADALLAAGRLDEAKSMLDALVEAYGRRRPPERAAVHFRLAQIAKARGDLPDALAQLETASTMDMAHPEVFRMLGDLARSNGQLDRAERAYRALLLVVRRRPAKDDTEEEIGPSEVLFELHRVAESLGNAERARETLESAFETAAQGEAESRKLERTLRASGSTELLLRALRARLGMEQDPAQAAGILGAVAEALESLGREGEALDARLEALSRTPLAPEAHAAARALARRLGASERYVTVAGGLTAAAEGGDEAYGLWLKLGEALEEDLGSPTRAAEAYAKAEGTGGARVEAWRALDRLYGSLGDRVAQSAILRKVVDAGAEASDPATWTDALYRLAELRLADADVGARSEGVDCLSWALDRDPDYERAGAMLVGAAQAFPGDEAVLGLYDRVARAAGDEAMLLDALERRAALADAPAEVLHEGVELATSRGEQERAERILERAVALAKARSGHAGEAVWALVALGERRKAAGDLAGAVAWLKEAADVAEPVDALHYGLDVAQMAASALGDLELAAEVYEKLRGRDPTNRDVWEPLLEVYRMMGDDEALERVIEETVGSVFDREGRNRLRMERARILLRREDRAEDAVRCLREVLEEEPEHGEAAAALEGLYLRGGRDDELAELLQREFDGARDRQDRERVVALGQRLGELVAKTRRRDAMDLYRAALDWEPENLALLRALVGLYTAEDDPYDRAEALDRLLAQAQGAEAASVALSLAALRQSLDDPAGARQALETGHERCPGDPTLCARLREQYTAEEDWHALAGLEARVALGLEDPEARVAGLRKAASLRGDQLGDPSGAADLLGQARQSAPGDGELLREHVRALGQAGRHEESAAEATRALEALGEGDGVARTVARVGLLRLRAELYGLAGNDAGAVADLESAWAMGEADVAQELAAALEQRRMRAVQEGSLADERGATLRLVQVLPSAGDPEMARELLGNWVERSPDDAEALWLLAGMLSSAQAWDDAVAVYQRLVELEQGERLTEAALRLIDACERTDRAAEARPGLERAHLAAPQHDDLRAQLAKLYQAQGAHRELAALYVKEAELVPDAARRFELFRKAGELYLDAAGDAESAVGPLERALLLRSGDHDATVLLADAYTASDRIEEASSLLNTAIAAHKGRRSKELAMLQHRMGRLAYAAGDRAIELAWLSVALDSDVQNGQVAAELADVAMELGQHEPALKALRALTLMKNPGPISRAMAFHKQGVIASQQGDTKRAAIMARKALAEDPNLTEAQELLATLGAGGG